MIRWAAAAALFFCLLATENACAQDALGEYNKAMHAYETYDYNTACSRMMNFYGATNSFHNVPPEVTSAIEKSGKSVMSLTQTAIQAENSREAGKACSDRLLQALLLAADDQWPQVEKALALAEQAHQQMIEQRSKGQGQTGATGRSRGFFAGSHRRCLAWSELWRNRRMRVRGCAAKRCQAELCVRKPPRDAGSEATQCWAEDYGETQLPAGC